jgi:hypothetical protein
MFAVLCEQYKESSNQCNQIALVDAQKTAMYSLLVEDRATKHCLQLTKLTTQRPNIKQ